MSSLTSMTLVVLYFLVSWAILLPFLVYLMIQHYKYKNNNILKKRYRSITMLEFTALTTLSVINLPLFILWIEGDNLNLSKTMIYVIRVIEHNTWFIAINLLIIVGVLKYWHLYYDISLAIQVKNNKWLKYLTCNKSLKYHSWFIAKKQSYGSIKYTSKIAYVLGFIAYFINSILFFIIKPLLSETNRGIFILVFSFGLPLITFCFICRTSLKTPKFYDEIYVHTEMRLLKRFWIFVFTPLGALYYSLFFFGNDVSKRKVALIGSICTYFICIGFIVVLLLYPILQIKQFEKLKVCERSISTSAGLNSVLKNMDTFSMFMDHLVKEFSIECLLSVTEFIQFKLLLKSDTQFYEKFLEYKNEEKNFDMETGMRLSFQGRKRSISNAKDLTKHIKLPKEIPVSCIVGTKIDSVENYYSKALKLVEKYIKHNSELEINISYDHRNEILDYFNRKENINYLELFSIFDNCILSMWNLMKDSFQRFVRSNIVKSI